MNITKPVKIIGIIAVSLLGLAVLANIGINLLIKNRLPKILEEKNDTAYDLTYSDLNFSIFSNSLSIENAELTPKKNASIRKDIDFYGKVAEISVSGVNFYELLKNKNLKAYTISVKGPDITVLLPEVRDTLKSESKLASVIDIDKISVQQAHLRLMNTAGDSLLHEVHNFNAEIDGVHMGEYTVEKDIPFTYTDYKFSIDSLYSVVNDLQVVKSGTVDIGKGHLEIENFRLLPYISRSEFRNRETSSNSRVLVEVPKLSLKGTDWGYDREDLFVNIGNIGIDSISVRILDQKKQTVFQQAKKDAEKIIRPLIPFRMDVKELNIKKSSFNSLGVLDVQNVNINIRNISNRVHEHLLIGEFELNNPQFVHIPGRKGGGSKNGSGRLNDRVLIEKVLIKNAGYVLKDPKGRYNKLTVENFNLTLNKIEVNDETIKAKIPFTYKDPLLSAGKIRYDDGKDYVVHAGGLKLKEADASVNDFKLVPKITRRQHAHKLKYAKDYYNISSGPIQFNGYRWGFDQQEEFFIKFREIVINKADASIYRDVSIPLAPVENHLYSYRLRHVKFPFEVDVLKVRNSRLTYEEVAKPGGGEPGKLTFADFNITAQNLYSGYKRKSGPRTQINVQTQFMQSGRLISSWSFNIMDPTDSFNINGDLANFPAPAMNPFLKPYMNVRANGTIDHMAFNFSGDNSVSKGDFAISFKDLKMKLYNEENKERKLASAAANLFVRTDTDGLKKTEVKKVDRKKDRSFFNFLWLNVMQGLKQTVI